MCVRESVRVCLCMCSCFVFRNLAESTHRVVWVYLSTSAVTAVEVQVVGDGGTGHGQGWTLSVNLPHELWEDAFIKCSRTWVEQRTIDSLVRIIKELSWCFTEPICRTQRQHAGSGKHLHHYHHHHEPTNSVSNLLETLANHGNGYYRLWLLCFRHVVACDCMWGEACGLGWVGEGEWNIPYDIIAAPAEGWRGHSWSPGLHAWSQMCLDCGRKITWSRPLSARVLCGFVSTSERQEEVKKETIQSEPTRPVKTGASTQLTMILLLRYQGFKIKSHIPPSMVKILLRSPSFFII